ncbi:MAG: tetratricopeptide repeat protein [Aulosira sp. ZfuVER01]|nr:tetratricopeptide repeat protein [Aulosira sp. ZfuVER01]MDZ7996466.1 tetratricopeptide repeat protein [Aulosira sp. DedVER01a]MDZ8050326.1 tetratricopeptide repeat protein [Aulosira sp. ZfuCHP01]
MDSNAQDFNQSKTTQSLQVDVSLYIKKAYNHFAQGNIEGAIADFNTAVCIHPNSAELYTARANFRKKKLGDRQGALEDYTKAIYINPHNAFFYYWRSQIYQELGNQQKAIEDYNAAVTLAPEDTMYYLI